MNGHWMITVSELIKNQSESEPRFNSLYPLEYNASPEIDKNDCCIVEKISLY